jgi:hypothetical protein
MQFCCQDCYATHKNSSHKPPCSPGRQVGCNRHAVGARKPGLQQQQDCSLLQRSRLCSKHDTFTLP